MRRVLQFAGIDVNARCRELLDATPLHLAASRSEAREMLAALLSKGADVHAVDYIGRTPQHWARTADAVGSWRRSDEQGC